MNNPWYKAASATRIVKSTGDPDNLPPSATLEAGRGFGTGDPDNLPPSATLEAGRSFGRTIRMSPGPPSRLRLSVRRDFPDEVVGRGSAAHF